MHVWGGDVRDPIHAQHPAIIVVSVRKCPFPSQRVWLKDFLPLFALDMSSMPFTHSHYQHRSRWRYALALENIFSWSENSGPRARSLLSSLPVSHSLSNPLSLVGPPGLPHPSLLHPAPPSSPR